MLKPSLTLFFFASIFAGCTPTRTTIDPPFEYKGRVYDDWGLRLAAEEACGIRLDGDPKDQPQPFVTDGCSMYPDSTWRECCIEHDVEYWCGGATLNRGEADRKLRQCVRERSSSFNAFVMYLGVRLGGSRLTPFSWRWGYGYSWPYKDKNTAQASGTAHDTN